MRNAFLLTWHARLPPQEAAFQLYRPIIGGVSPPTPPPNAKEGEEAAAEEGEIAVPPANTGKESGNLVFLQASRGFSKFHGSSQTGKPSGCQSPKAERCLDLFSSVQASVQLSQGTATPSRPEALNSCPLYTQSLADFQLSDASRIRSMPMRLPALVLQLRHAAMDTAQSVCLHGTPCRGFSAVRASAGRRTPAAKRRRRTHGNCADVAAAGGECAGADAGARLGLRLRGAVHHLLGPEPLRHLCARRSVSPAFQNPVLHGISIVLGFGSPSCQRSDMCKEVVCCELH